MALRVDGPARAVSESEQRSVRLDDRLAQRGGWVECLRVPAALFGLAARARAALFDHGWLPVARLAVPVISVGNLTTGGAGKSPFTRWLAQWLLEAGWRPGVLARGYAAADGQTADEALELAAALPEVPHVERADRVSGGAELEARGVDVIVLDDGFQHRRLHRDLDLVLVDASRPWGLPRPPRGGAAVRALLPRGLLRESPAALGRAHAVLLTRADSVPADELSELREEIEGLVPGTPIVACRHAPRRLVPLVPHEPTVPGAPIPAAGGAQGGLEGLRGLAVDLVSGIGNPAAFERTVGDLGARVVEHRRYPDHHRWAEEDLAGLGTRPLLTTGKDAPKLARLEAVRAGRPALAVLETGIEITSGEGPLRALLEALPRPTVRRERDALHEGLHG